MHKIKLTAAALAAMVTMSGCVIKNAAITSPTEETSEGQSHGETEEPTAEAASMTDDIADKETTQSHGETSASETETVYDERTEKSHDETETTMDDTTEEDTTEKSHDETEDATEGLTTEKSHDETSGSHETTTAQHETKPEPTTIQPTTKEPETEPVAQETTPAAQPTEPASVEPTASVAETTTPEPTTTRQPETQPSTTVQQTTPEPTTPEPTTPEPTTTAEQTTPEPTTEEPTTVAAATAVSISAYWQRNSNFIKVGDVLDPAAFVVTVTFSDGTSVINPAGWTASKLVLDQSVNDIVISYGGLSCVINITATEPDGRCLAACRYAFELQNEVRAKAGVAPLVWNEYLYRVACSAAKTCADAGQIKHGLTNKYRQGGGWTMPWTDDVPDEELVKLLQSGTLASYQVVISENLACGANGCEPLRASERLIDSLVDSPGHYADMIGDVYLYGAIGMYQNSAGTWYMSCVYNAPTNLEDGNNYVSVVDMDNYIVWWDHPLAEPIY